MYIYVCCVLTRRVFHSSFVVAPEAKAKGVWDRKWLRLVQGRCWSALFSIIIIR